jgi:hypothetical protein
MKGRGAGQLAPLIFMWTREKDGVDHINIYSNGLTELGRMLSHFANYPITITVVDSINHKDSVVTFASYTFNTVEGYIYWLQTNHKNKDSLMTMPGWIAKEEGRKMRSECPSKISPEQLISRVKAANLAKISRYPEIQTALRKSKLPFAHYYHFFKRIFPGPPEWMWVLEFWEEVRKSLQEKYWRQVVW